MKRLSVIAMSLFLALSQISCQSNSGSNENSEQVAPMVSDISVEEFAELMNSQPGQILDVRTPGEIAEGYVEGASFIDITQGNFEAEAQELQKDQPIYVYCKAGGRSANASQKLSDMGFTQVYNVMGGMDAWKAKSFPMVTPE